MTHRPPCLHRHHSETALKLKMTLLFVILSLLSISTGAYADNNEASTGQTITVMSYNIRNCRGLDDYNQINIARTAKVISEAQPDIVGLQELDRNATRSGKRNLLEELAKTTNLIGNFAPAIEFQGGHYGIGTLSAEKPVRTYNIPLPGKEEARTLQVTEFPSFVFFNTHWSLTKQSRLASAELICKERSKFTKPVILVGDFNAEPDSEEIQLLMKSWTVVSPDANTFPADKPEIRIDFIFISNATDVSTSVSQVVNEPVASDHRPLRAVISFK